MLKKAKIDFVNGYAYLGNKKKKLFVDNFGVYFKTFMKKTYLCTNNCEVLL